MLAGGCPDAPWKEGGRIHVSQQSWQKGFRMSLASRCRNAAMSICSTKATICDAAHGPCSLPPMLDYRLRRCGKNRVETIEDDLFEGFPDAWNSIIKRGLPKDMLVLSDSFMTCEDGAVVVDGDLSQAFSSDPASNVKAVLSVCGVNTHTGHQHHIFIPYGYDDDGMPCFHAPREAEYSPDEIPRCRITDLLAVCVVSVRIQMNNRR